MKPWRQQAWGCPPGSPDPLFVARMEALLALYAWPWDPRFPLVCLDEAAKILHAHARPPTALWPGGVARYDYAYRRQGTAALFMLSAPLLGGREVKVRARRTAVDFAHVRKELVDVHFPEAEQIVRVCDNLNTHTPKSLYQAFDKATADRLAAQLAWHYTPPHASWLNLAEVEISVLARQCLRRRLATREELAAEVAAWCRHRNADPPPAAGASRPRTSGLRCAVSILHPR